MTRTPIDPDEPIHACTAAALDAHEFERFDAHTTMLGGGFGIRRALPVAQRRMVGPFCFLDHIGPFDVSVDGATMRIAPHPHIGLQTITWLLSGTILHRDSLGYTQPIRPGQLNVMTSGRGISHSEETPEGFAGTLHGVQLWVALPDADRDVAPAFEHHAAVPRIELDGVSGWLFAGAWNGLHAPGRHFGPLVGADLTLSAAATQIPLDPTFEHGIIVLEGTANISGQRVGLGELLYLRPGRTEVVLQCDEPTRIVLVGGPPFEEQILMWWNFVARTRDEIVQARDQWEGSEFFGRVPGWGDERLTSPAILPADPSR